MSIMREWLKASPLFNFNQVLRDRWVRAQAASIPAGSRVLDVGAGSAPYRDFFSHCRYFTQDFALLDPRQLPQGAYSKVDYVSDAASIPVESGSFDAVICTEVLEHVPEPISVVKEISRVLRPGGKLILTAPLGSGIHQEPYHFYGGFTPYWYERFLAETGFVGIRVEPNAGSFRAFSQESLRFVLASRPSALPMPILAKVIWTPVWLISIPLLAGVIPISCLLLDSLDRERRFTVGFHVTAVRSQ
ncbi:MAG: class I SAM-dependent methyltransferase [Burkholderiales bacterium]